MPTQTWVCPHSGSRLPYDILKLIFDLGRCGVGFSLHDYCKFVLVCHEWYLAGIECIYESIIGLNDEQLVKLLTLTATSTSNNPCPTQHIRHLVVDWSGATICNFSCWSYHPGVGLVLSERDPLEGKLCTPRAPLLNEALRRLPKLQSLEIYVHPVETGSDTTSLDIFRDFHTFSPFSLQSFSTNLICGPSLTKFLNHHRDLKSVFLLSSCSPAVLSLDDAPGNGCTSLELPNLQEFGFMDIGSAANIYCDSPIFTHLNNEDSSGELSNTVAYSRERMANYISPVKRQTTPIVIEHQSEDVVSFHWHVIDGDMARFRGLDVIIPSLPHHQVALEIRVGKNKTGVLGLKTQGFKTHPRLMVVEIWNDGWVQLFGRMEDDGKIRRSEEIPEEILLQVQ